MNMLQYSIRLWVLNTGWLTLYPICIAQGSEVKFEFTSVVLYYILTTWISTKPGFYTLGYCFEQNSCQSRVLLLP
jgi:hypothetical protein